MATAYNVAQITITDSDGDPYTFEMQSYELSDPINTTSRYGQQINEGIGDPWNLTGEINHNTNTFRFLKALAKKGQFFSLTSLVKNKTLGVEKRVYSQCVVQSDIFLASLERGAEQIITINFSCNKLETDTAIDPE